MISRLKNIVVAHHDDTEIDRALARLGCYCSRGGGGGVARACRYISGVDAGLMIWRTRPASPTELLLALCRSFLKDEPR